MKRIVVLLLSLMLFVSCQLTSEQEYMVNKGDGAPEGKQTASVVPVLIRPVPSTQKDQIVPADAEELQMEASPLSMPALFPDRWEEDLAIGPTLTVSIHVQIRQPAFPVYPLYRTTPMALTAAWAQKIISAFLPVPVSAESKEMTKEDWKREYRAFLEELDEQKRSARMGEESILPQEEIDREIQTFENLIADAPITNEPFAVEDYSSVTEKSTHVFTLENGEKAYVSLGEGSFPYMTICRDCGDAPYLLDIYQYEEDRVWNREMDRLWRPVSLSDDQAIQQAQAALEDLQLTGYGVAEVYPANLLSGVGEQKSIGQGMVVEFLRDFGYPLLRRIDPTEFLRYGEDSQYNRPLPEERITVYVEEAGVRYLSIERPKRIVKVENENASLLPFEEVQQRLKNVLSFGLIDFVGEYCYTAEVYGAVLTTYSIRIQDSEELYEMPCWVFFIDPFDTSSFSQAEERVREMVLINAVDGAVIRPRDMQ